MLSRRTLLALFSAPLLPEVAVGSVTNAVIQPYFPNTAYQFVWRNWDLVPTSRIAEALETDKTTVMRIGSHMHLNTGTACRAVDERMRLNILRRNWFFVPSTQIASLLGVQQSEIEKILDRDAFYRSHLGAQPPCEPIRLNKDSVLNHSLGYFEDTTGDAPAEPRFGFEREMSQALPDFHAPAREDRPLVIAYPYFCPYGDVLADPNYLSYYPLGLLQRMVKGGVSAIWVHALLRDLVRFPLFQQDYPFQPARIQRLTRLIAHCKEAGLNVYLYLNEPRGAHDAFFQHHPEMRGAPGRKGDGLWCMCTSSHQTRRFLREGSEALFTEVPGLEGLLLITVSENPTNCYSLTRHPECSRCSHRRGADVIGEVVREIAAGAHAAKASAHVIAWDWSWGIVEDDPQAAIIQALPSEVSLLVDFERGTQIERDGVRSEVDEYSLSTPGPSPRAAQHLELARKRKLPILGKAQIGTTWEVGTLPFLPIPNLVAEKITAFERNGLRGGMFSWTLGSCPSANWDVFAQLVMQPDTAPKTAIGRVARDYYGDAASDLVQKSWTKFAEAFRNYPFSNSIVYSSFVQQGPANQLYVRPSALAPRILNSFDTLDWTAPFGPERTADMFAEMGQRWREAVAQFREAEARMDATAKRRAQRDLRVIEAAGLYFDSIACLIRYYRMRDQSTPHPRELRVNLTEQLRIAERFLELCRADSRIGFEASVGYMYLPLDVREKIAGCRYLLTERLRAREGLGSSGFHHSKYV